MVLRHITTPNEIGTTIMAIDWSLLEENVPTIHTFTWSPPSVSIGYLQNTKRLNIPLIKEKGFLIVRRPTGGKAVIHIGDISLAIYLPNTLLPKRAKEAYNEIANIIKDVLTTLTNIPITQSVPQQYENNENCFSSSTGYELGIDGKKLVGIAARKTRKGMLVHATIRLIPFPEYVSSFFIPPEKTNNTSLSNYGKNISLNELHSELIRYISKKYDLTPTSWHPNNSLILKKYESYVSI